MSEAVERFALVLKFAGEHRLTDVVFKAGAKPFYRRVCQLIARPQEDAFSQEALAAIAENLMSGEQMTRFNSGAEITLSYPLIGAGRFRVHIFRQRGTLGLSVRVHPGRPRSFRELALPSAWQPFVAQQGGLLVVASGAGHGRTTTLGAMVQLLNETAPARRIVTVGQTIELAHVDATGWTAQRGLGVDAPDWSAAINGAISQGADVLALDDPEGCRAWELAVDAAERGMLVIATVGARDAGTALGRIVGSVAAVDEPRFRRRLAAALLGVTEQSQVPSTDGSRSVVAWGLLTMEPRAYAILRDGHDPAGLYDIMHSRALGMSTADQALSALVASGAIRSDIALAYATRPQALQAH